MSTSIARELAPQFATLSDGLQSSIQRVADRLKPFSILEVDPKDGYEHTEEGMDYLVDRATAAGFTVIKGTPHTLLLDLDGPSSLDEDYLKLLCEWLQEVPTITQWKSKDGVGTHVVLRFMKTTFTPAEAVAVEAALGADLKRAILCIIDLKNEVPDPRVLFMPAQKEVA